MKLIDYKCPHCGGEIHIAEGRKEAFCEFCGSKLFFEDDNVKTNVTVIRDEARIKELEMIQEARAKAEEKRRWKKIDKISLILGIVLWIPYFITEANGAIPVKEKVTFDGVVGLTSVIGSSVFIIIFMIRVLYRHS